MDTVRLLGAVLVIIFVASVLSERLRRSAVGSGSMSDILVNISHNTTRMRSSILLAMVDSVGFIVLGVLYYVVFNRQHEVIALVALGFYLAQAITRAVSKIGSYALITLSREFVEADSPDPSQFQVLGDFLHRGLDRQGDSIQTLFFCLGGALWYYMLLKSGFIPLALSIWGLAAVSLLLVPVLLQIYDRDFTHPLMVVGLPYLPFELVLGVWLIVKGFD